MWNKEELKVYIHENYIEELQCARSSLPLEKTRLAKVKRVEAMPMMEMSCGVFQVEKTFQEFLFELIDQKGIKDSEVYNKANIDRKLFSKIRSDKTYSPSKNTVIQLCFGLELDLETALDLLGRAGYTLSNSKLFDVIVKYFILNNNYDLLELDQALYEHDQSVILK